jgi:single-stranded-DNA-specific exonuclease
VSRSALGRGWLPRLDQGSDKLATAIAQTHGVPDALARVLAGRGVTVQGAPAFLQPRLRDLLPDPSTLTDMDAAGGPPRGRVGRREAVAVFGDYDVDGACSAALLADHLTARGCPVQVHIPDRITEGYGPNVEAVRALAAAGARLLVTVGLRHCRARAAGGGGAARDGCRGARPPRRAGSAARRGRDREPEPSGRPVRPRPSLRGRIVFMAWSALARELRRRGRAGPAPDLLAGLDLVALATVADVVPLTGTQPGLRATGAGGHARPGPAGACGAPRRVPPGKRARGLAPRLPARAADQRGGRIGDASLGARLLREQDPGAAAAIAQTLDRLNGERQVIEAAAVADALAEADRLVTERPDLPVLVLASADWHPGILGLVAARVKERPAVPFSPSRRSRTGRSRGPAGRLPGSTSAGPCVPRCLWGRREGRRPRDGGRRHPDRKVSEASGVPERELGVSVRGRAGERRAAAP